MRLSSSQLLGLLFASCNPDDLISKVTDKEAENERCGLRKRRGRKAKAARSVSQTSLNDCHYLLNATVDKVSVVFEIDDVISTLLC